MSITFVDVTLCLATRWRKSSLAQSRRLPLSFRFTNPVLTQCFVLVGNSGSEKPPAVVTHLMRQKKDFSCMHSVGEDSEYETEKVE